jgi:hypothetical protein
MKKLVTRSRSLVLVAVLAVVAAMFTVSTVHAASTTAGIHAAASHATAASDAPCTFDFQSTTCQSTDRAVTVNNYFTGDQTGCSYVSAVTWGDGQSTTNVTYSDPGDGYDLLGNHTYGAAGTYTIAVTLELTAGTCTANSFNAKFTLLAPTPTPTPTPTPPTPTPSPSPSPPSKVCPTVLLGLHGMQEGPSPTDPTAKSTTGGITVVESTFKSFQTAAAATGHSAKDYKTDDVPYPITEWYDLDNPFLMRTIVSDVVDGSNALNTAIRNYMALCPSGKSKFELVGYSEGAWVIEYWLHFHQSAADKYVKAIQLYGDPNYYEVYGHDRHGVHAYQGLSRLAGLTFGWYGPPYPNPNTPYRVKTVCITKDPVCGKGYTDSLTEHALQFGAAGKCLISDCPHLDRHYDNGYTIRGAEFLAKYAF